MLWYHCKRNERKEKINRCVGHFTMEELQSYKDLFTEMRDYCKQINHANLNYWQYELNFIKACIKLKECE